MLPAERHRGFRGAPGRFSVVTEVFEPSLEEIHVGERRDMSGLGRVRDRLVHERPLRVRLRRGAKPREPDKRSPMARESSPKSELGFAVSLGVVNSQRLFAMRSRACAKSPWTRRVNPKRRCAAAASVGRAARSASRRKLSAASKADPSSPRKKL